MCERGGWAVGVSPGDDGTEVIIRLHARDPVGELLLQSLGQVLVEGELRAECDAEREQRVHLLATEGGRAGRVEQRAGASGEEW